MLIDDLDRLPECFKDGYRGVMLLHRNKDGETGNAQRKAYKIITNGVNAWYDAIERLSYLRMTGYRDYRIYSSVNPRNMRKAIHEFKRRQLQAAYDHNDDYDFYTDIENRFFSSAMSPVCRDHSLFLIDCDSEHEYEKAIDMIPKDLVVFDYETRNGRHIITKPFNPNEIPITINKDGLISIC